MVLTREIENLELERAEAEGILYEYEVQEEFPVDYQDILEDAAWEEAWKDAEQLNEARTPIYTTRDLGTIDLYVSDEEMNAICHGQDTSRCGWDPNGGPTC